jgi:hypothetical protein
MNSEQKQQAKNLYFQTDLTKTQIAQLLDVSRTSIHTCIKVENWDRLKMSAEHLPSLIAEHCYYIMGHLTKNILSENRILRPITRDESETMHKLTLTINKLKNRATANESMEMFGYFMEMVNKKSPALAQQIKPVVEEYLGTRAGVFMTQLQSSKFTPQGLLPTEERDTTEDRLDMEDILEWENDNERRLREEPADNNTSAPAQIATSAPASKKNAEPLPANTQPAGKKPTENKPFASNGNISDEAAARRRAIYEKAERYMKKYQEQYGPAAA